MSEVPEAEAKRQVFAANMSKFNLWSRVCFLQRINGVEIAGLTSIGARVSIAKWNQQPCSEAAIASKKPVCCS